LFVIARYAQDEKGAVAFLYHLRKLRQTYPRIRWIFTGSIGLESVARRGGFQGAFLDMSVFPLEPFREPAARSLLEVLCRENKVPHPFSLDDNSFAHLASELGWLSPYYIEHIANQIKPTGACSGGGLPLALPADIDLALDTILQPAFRPYFAAWEEHISKNFPTHEAEFLRLILDICCAEPDGERSPTLYANVCEMRPGLLSRDFNNLLTALANDGFLREIGGRWRFRSGLLRRYWKRYQCG
jgi:uncharacterized protein